MDNDIRRPQRPNSDMLRRPAYNPRPRVARPVFPSTKIPAAPVTPTAPAAFQVGRALPQPGDTGTQGTSKTPKKLLRRGNKKIRRTVLIVVALVVAFGGWFGWSLLGNLNKVFHGNIISDANALMSHTKLKGEDQGRVNILFAGDSNDRTDNGGGGDLTDSIMVVSIDTIHHTGFMLSIPRDTWVTIPGHGHSKINAANESTTFHQDGYPSGGMGQLEQVITQNFGIPINYYALVNYTAFKDAVNAVNGINFNVQSRDPRGLYDASRTSPTDRTPLVKLPNGPVNLNGDQALNLARARGDAYGSYGFEHSDFDRTEHQRQMLTALEQKSVSAGVLSNPFKISQLFGAIGKNVQSDLHVGEAMRLGQLAKTMNITNLQSLSLGGNGKTTLLVNYWAPDGEEALAPAAGLDNFSQIQQYYRQLTSSDPTVKESPNVVVLNASNATGAAHKEATALQGKGFSILGAADADNTYDTSLVVDLTNGQKPASKKLLQQLLNGTPTATGTSASAEAAEAAAYHADFVVILGKDRAQAQ